jgi:hypothetical protein
VQVPWTDISYAAFLYLASAQAPNDECLILETTIVSAEVTGTEGRSAVHINKMTHARFHALNFTSCSASAYASAFYIAPYSVSFIASLMTVVGGESTTALHVGCDSDQTIEHSNFYRNQDTDGTVYAYEYPVTLNDCIFSGNTNDLGFSSKVTTLAFELQDCGFSKTITLSTDRFTKDNVVEAGERASIVLFHINTAFCDGHTRAWPIATASPSAVFSGSDGSCDLLDNDRIQRVNRPRPPPGK